MSTIQLINTINANNVAANARREARSRDPRESAQINRRAAQGERTWVRGYWMNRRGARIGS